MPSILQKINSTGQFSRALPGNRGTVDIAIVGQDITTYFNDLKTQGFNPQWIIPGVVFRLTYGVSSDTGTVTYKAIVSKMFQPQGYRVVNVGRGAIVPPTGGPTDGGTVVTPPITPPVQPGGGDGTVTPPVPPPLPPPLQPNAGGTGTSTGEIKPPGGFTVGGTGGDRGIPGGALPSTSLTGSTTTQTTPGTSGGNTTQTVPSQAPVPPNSPPTGFKIGDTGNGSSKCRSGQCNLRI